jgi:hypothetical protein
LKGTRNRGLVIKPSKQLVLEPNPGTPSHAKTGAGVLPNPVQPVNKHVAFAQLPSQIAGSMNAIADRSDGQWQLVCRRRGGRQRANRIDNNAHI